MSQNQLYEHPPSNTVRKVMITWEALRDTSHLIKPFDGSRKWVLMGLSGLKSFRIIVWLASYQSTFLAMLWYKSFMLSLAYTSHKDIYINQVNAKTVQWYLRVWTFAVASKTEFIVIKSRAEMVFAPAQLV